MISLSVILPIEREKTHLTSLLLSVLHRGTENYPTIAALNRRLDYLFGTEMTVRNYYRGDRHVIGIAADLLGEEYLPQDGSIDLMENVLEVMREILFHPLLDEKGMLTEKYVESEKKLQKDAILALRNSPRAYALEHCGAVMYRDEPCGIPICGTVESVQSVTPEMLSARWRELIEHLAFECFYVGPENPAEVAERVCRVFASYLPKNPAQAFPRCDVCGDRDDAVKHCEEELPVSQGQLVIGLRTNISVADRDYCACAVANEMLGVSPVSKLFVNVREKHGLCYHCSSHYNMYKGAIMISCGLLPQNRTLAQREIFNQIEALSQGDFEDGELTAAKLSLENSYRQLEDNPTALESFYLGRALFHAEDTIDGCRRGFAAVTREDIVRVARKWRTDTVYFLNATAADGEEAENEED
ncbi:MAG: insulinase family protein [Clostridia bacterium]|nr:insulinase family protein [Clostridia bacterium]